MTVRCGGFLIKRHQIAVALRVSNGGTMETVIGLTVVQNYARTSASSLTVSLEVDDDTTHHTSTTHHAREQRTTTTTDDDSDWTYCHPLVEGDTNTIVCNYCEKITKGGITRAKEHLVGKSGNAASCKKTPPDVVEELKGYMANKKNFEFGEPIGCDGNEDEFADSCNATALAAKTKCETKKGPRDRCINILLAFWYKADLSFNLIKLKSFENMVASIGQYGPHLSIPSYHDIRVPLLKKEVEYTENLMKDHKEQWVKYAGTMFLKSVDGPNFVKTGEKLFELLDAIVEEVGEENVVQVVTNNVATIHWEASLVVGFIYAHSNTLSLLRNCTNKKELLRHAITRFATSYLTLERLHKEKANIRKMFISNEWILNKLSKEPKGKEAAKVVLMPSFWNSVSWLHLSKMLHLVDGERKPVMGYIYEAMDKAKETIIKSFNNNESKYKDVFAIIHKRWNYQLHRLLHAAAHFLNLELFYDNTDLEFDFEVTNGLFDYIKKLVPQFDVQQKILTELHLYKIGAEHFGSEFAMTQRKTHSPMLKHVKEIGIHSKKRNRFEHKKLHDLVFSKYNQQLKQRYNARDEIDPISLNDIDVCNEWLVGEMDEDDDNDARNDLVFEDDDALNWATVYEASGAEKRERKQPTSVGISPTAAAHTSKKQAMVVGSSSRKQKEIQENDEDLEFDDIELESEEEEIMVNFEAFDGEEGEGDAPLPYDNNEEDYVGIGEDY
ncbi:hypothetical protein HKD37_04G010081 [Glycine soja]